MKKQENETGHSLSQALGLGSQLGFNIALPLIAGILAGRYLDQWLNTHGVFLIIFLLAALFVGGYNFYRVIMRNIK
jgi:ATP synthase protein I